MAKTIDKTYDGVIATEHKFDEQSQKWTTSYTQDVEPILKKNKEERNNLLVTMQAKMLAKLHLYH